MAKLYENVDPVESLIPIKPVAHYTMGGIEVGVESQTNVSGLFACGECANHNVHGANRLGGNSLLEIVVFGREAGANAAKYALTLQTQRAQTQTTQTLSTPELFAFEHTQEPELDFYRVRDEVATLFYEKVGIVRTKSELQTVQKRLQELSESLPKMGVSDSSHIYNTNLVEFLEFVNMLEICQMVVEAALKREVSIGAHYIV